MRLHFYEGKMLAGNIKAMCTRQEDSFVFAHFGYFFPNHCYLLLFLRRIHEQGEKWRMRHFGNGCMRPTSAG